MADNLFACEAGCSDDMLDVDEVGYRKPPKHTQFQKGVSGNPKGRPKKARDFDSQLLQEAESLVTIRDNGKQKRIPKIEGIFKQLTNKAMAGNPSATKTFFSLYQPAREKATLAAAPTITLREEQKTQVEQVLADLSLSAKPVIQILNKIDLAPLRSFPIFA